MLDDFLIFFSNAIQIAIIAACVYYALRYLRGTRGAQILIGLASIILSVWAVTFLLNLDVLRYILQALSMSLLIGLLVVFHPELRRALAQLGQHSYLQLTSNAGSESPVDVLVEASSRLAAQKIGALIAIERGESLNRIEETGVPLDALISPELLISIFKPPAPLHDGGVIIKGKRILAAHCLFPLDSDARIRNAGTRHRAALGLAKDSDALVIVVSEEKGTISIAHDDVIRRNVDARALERFLKAAFVPTDRKVDQTRMIFGKKEKTRWSWRFLKDFVKVKDPVE